MKVITTISIILLFVFALISSPNVNARQLGKSSTSDPDISISSSSVRRTKKSKSKKNDDDEGPYEVWASDQSNSVAATESPGTKGSFLWIWDSESIQGQLDKSGDAKPLSCTPLTAHGPCDLLEIFPQTLAEYGADDFATGKKLEDLDAFGRLHGVIKDPSNRYVNANIFAPGGGYVGVIDTETKEAIGLFRVTKVASTNTQRSVHLSFWSADGSAILIANLGGKMIERINVIRDNRGIITDLQFDRSASVYLGKDYAFDEGATYFKGNNAFGNPLLGSIVGSYDDADTSDLTPTGACKESGCTTVGAVGIEGGERTNNVPICPIPSSNNNVYVTVGGGGLLVLKLDTTPMKIVGEYGNAIINGAGLGGVESNDKMFINSGVSASGAGSSQSTFGVYAFDDTGFDVNAMPMQNTPMAMQVFKDPTNTNTIGNIDGTRTMDSTGQLPNQTTRRDSHGMGRSIDGKYLHVADRIQNVIEVFDTETFHHVSTYDLVSKDGESGRSGPSGPCLARSVTDDAGLMMNDPAPDLFEITPDGKHFMVAFRGPKPVSVSHASQGSCPGVGIVEITEGGKSGRLVDVLRSTNNVDTVSVGSITGGRKYTGVERSDIHGVIVVSK